ncbi:MAG: cytochrome c family protein [Hyphomicrobiaceae bacterium]|nr:cytochrome c family protein [Hyphomicrobiaceae bacterium]
MLRVRIVHRMLAVAVALSTVMAAVPAVAQDAVRGRHVFRKCAVCHVSNPNSTELLAPPLHNVVGRVAASLPGFQYSEIMKTAGARGLVWTKDALYYFLDRPEQFMPGTYMAFAGLEAQERSDVIAYLESLTRAFNKTNGDRSGDAAPGDGQREEKRIASPQQP